MLKLTIKESKICSFTAPNMILQMLLIEYIDKPYAYIFEIRENRKKIAEKSDLLKAMYIFNDIQQKFTWQNILSNPNKLDL